MQEIYLNIFKYIVYFRFKALVLLNNCFKNFHFTLDIKLI